MNENINLCDILKGHEGETFYSPTFGNCKLRFISDVLYFKGINSTLSFAVDVDGTYRKDGEICIFPSKEQRDWNKWLEEQKPKVPKIWNEIKSCNIEVWQHISRMDYGPTEPIVKSALALLKIHQLIEVGYGGNVTNEEWNLEGLKYTISYYSYKDRLTIIDSIHIKYNNIAFHTKEQAREFLKYPENIQLLKDYFMI